MGCVRRLNYYADVVCEMQCMTDALFKEGKAFTDNHDWFAGDVL